MAMEFFCCYHSYRRKVAKLSDQEVGRLFRALLEYSETGETQELTGRESIAFDFIADDIDRAKKSYKDKCAQNAENGKKGGRPKNQSEKEKAVGFLESEKSQNKDKYEYENKDKNEGNTPPNPQKGDGGVSSDADGFDRFWSAYPKKAAKPNARKAFRKIKPDEALLERMLSALEVQKASRDWQRDAGQYIPYPATWLNGMRWEDKTVPQRPSADTGQNSSIDMEKLHEMLHRDSM